VLLIQFQHRQQWRPLLHNVRYTGVVFAFLQRQCIELWYV
jgi:hypothetical protein